MTSQSAKETAEAVQLIGTFMQHFATNVPKGDTRGCWHHNLNKISSPRVKRRLGKLSVCLHANVQFMSLQCHKNGRHTRVTELTYSDLKCHRRSASCFVLNTKRVTCRPTRTVRQVLRYLSLSCAPCPCPSQRKSGGLPYTEYPCAR